MRTSPFLLAIASFLSACDDSPVVGDDTDRADTDTDADTDSDSDTDTEPVDTDAQHVDATCKAWNLARRDLREAAWTGDVDTCDAGDVDAAGRTRALGLVNLYRTMAGLPTVTDDAAKNDTAQDCALMMHANNTLSHTPPSSWACYSDSGATGAGRSNIATGPGVMAVDMYMQDWGNDSTIGHRRWILSNSLGPIGLGSTSEFSCMYVIYGSGAAAKPWTAWPPPGPFPIQGVEMSFVPLDETGWTVQSDSIDLSAATVTITRDDGKDMPVTLSVLLSGYGSTWAIRFLPRSWTSEVGRTYTVSVGNIAQPFSYDVEIVDCGT